jgi:hypothetical protein
MATVTHPASEVRHLRGRLGALRRRLYVVSTLRGLGWVLTVLLLSAAVGGVLDWRLQLPALLRAVLLVSTLAAGAYLTFRLLYRPLALRSDDLSLALRVEESYPSLNDALASTVEFLDDPDALPGGISPSLREEAVRRARDKIEACDFNRIVDTRGLPLALLLLLLSTGVAALLVFLSPALALTAAVRLTNPFGALSWPPQTRLVALSAGPFDGPVALVADEPGSPADASGLRIGRGQPFLVRGKVERGNKENGVIPKRAEVQVRPEGGTPSIHSCEVISDESTGHFDVKLDTAHFPRGFRFRVVANDAVTSEYEVLVQQPPLLVPLEGKPSPQVTLDYPAYTGLASPQALPPGLGDVEAINGTSVTLRARTDRPLRRAWIEYQPDLKHANLSAYLAPLGATDVAGAAGLLAAGAAAFEPVAAELDGDRTAFAIRFLPSFSGLYVLHIEDDTRLRNSRPFALRLRPDPAPTVQLDRPSPSRDVLTVLAEAVLPVQVTAEDTIYAVRSVFVSYRTRRTDPPRFLALYDHQTAPRQVLAPVTGAAFLAGPTPALRPTHVACNRSLPVVSLKHSDGAPLQEGDVVILQAGADDFDDVTLNKQPGLSAEVEIRIVGRNALDVLLNQDQARIQQDLLRQREKERDALNKVLDAENRLLKGDKLNAEDRTQLLQAEQLQQQIRERIGNEREGLRAEVQRVLQTVEQNGLYNSSVRDRMKDVDRELQRIGEKELEQIEPRLADVRTLAELMEEQSGEAYRARMDKQSKQTAEKARAAQKEAQDKRAAADKAEELANKRPQDDLEKKQLLAEAQKARQQADQLAQKAGELEQQAAAERRSMDKPDLKTPQKQLAEARRDQEEVERTLSDLLDRLEPWSSSREIKGEAGKILEEQKKRLAELEELEKQGFLGKDPVKDLTENERLELGNQVDAQQRLAERTNKLLEKMKRVAADRADKDPETAQAIEAALQKAEEANINGKMSQARSELKQNHLEEAKASQQAAARELQKMVKAMEDRRADDLERLIKRMKETEHELAQLAHEQEELQKKVREASQIGDPAQREEALKKLTQQQRQLQQRTEELAKQLTRLRSDAAGRALGRAGSNMEQAGEQLRQGNNAEEKQDDVLDRLDDAQREVEKARKRAEDELAREQLTQFADVLKRLRERQAAHNAEAKRIQSAVKKNEGWGRALPASLRDLARNQRDLGAETASSGGKELAGTPVFAKQVRRAADSMTQAGARLEELYANIKNGEAPEPEDLPDEAVTRFQKEALHRLDQLLDAIKSETDALAKRNGGGGDGSGGDGEAGGGGDEAGLPPLGQVKLLKAMQAEVNQAIEAFRQKHPQLDKIDEKEKAEYEAIKRDQREVWNLLKALRNRDAEVSAKEEDKR